VAIVLVPVVFAILGAAVAYGVGRMQHLHGRALRAAVVGGAIGGAISGALTVPCIGIGAAVTTATALPSVVGTTAEVGALSGAQAVGNAIGQVAQNKIQGTPLRQGVVKSAVIGGISQAALTPVGAKLGRLVTPTFPLVGRSLSRVLPRVANSATATVISRAASEWAGETASEGLTDVATSLVPTGPPDTKPATRAPPPTGPRAKGISDALGQR
jgi:hypothetical protein